MSVTPLSPRRRLLLDAALHVVADEGLRGLTHRAVDRRAGLPEGSCSGYLRTRKALLSALTEYVAGTLTADVADLARSLEGHAEVRGPDGPSPEALELITGLFLRWLGERELLQAKLELSLEATRDPELAALLAASRRVLVGVVTELLAARDGIDQRPVRDGAAEAVVASYDGILAAALLEPADDRRDFLTRSSALVLGSLTGATGPGLG